MLTCRLSCFVVLFLSIPIASISNAGTVSLSGAVYRDYDLNGVLSVGEEVTGASVQLFRDDGDGIFDPQTDAFERQSSTDYRGHYAFDGLLQSASYFVQSTSSASDLVLRADTANLLSGGGFNLLIEGFGDLARIQADPRNTLSTENIASPSSIGGQIDIHLRYLGGPAEASLHINPFGLDNVLELNQSAGVSAVATVTWDGVDSDTSIDPMAGGLGGIDLTQRGINQAFAFQMGIDSAGQGEYVTLRVYSGEGLSSYTTSIPVTDGTTGAWHLARFGDFTGTADLTSVDAIQLEIGGNNPSIDAQLGPIGIVGSDFSELISSTPEPSASFLITMSCVCWLATHRRRRRCE